MSQVKINAKRLWSDLMEQKAIGVLPDGGSCRPALSQADEKARQWFVNKAKEAGLDVRIDAFRNTIARIPARDPNAKTLAMGSHLDSVPGGGCFDGPLGVVGALECARTIKENGLVLPYHLEVIAFTDEEGAYGASTVGSRAMMGTLKPGELTRKSTATGSCFADDLALVGGNADGEVIRDKNEFAWFLELHIEQGARLERLGSDCGVVTAVVGIERHEITFKGASDHAGSTPMQGRKDALVPAAALIAMIPTWAEEQNPEMVATVGVVNVAPGVSNIIPGECSIIIDMRSTKQADIDALLRRIEAYGKEHGNCSIRQIYKKPGVEMHPEAIAAIKKGAELEGYSCFPLPSGAGHDAHTFASFVPTAMVFTPCRNGISHSPDEWIEPEQAAVGTQVLLNAALILSGLLKN